MNEPTRYALVIVRDPRVPPNVIPKARDDGEWVRYDAVAPYLPKTLTADDKTPPDHSVVTDRFGQTFVVFGGGLHSPVAFYIDWHLALNDRAPLTLIHRGGTE